VNGAATSTTFTAKYAKSAKDGQPQRNGTSTARAEAIR